MQKRKIVGVITILTVSIFGRSPSNIKLFYLTIRTRKLIEEKDFFGKYTK